jgi:hypothetical protein
VKWFTPGKRARVECPARQRDTAVIGLPDEIDQATSRGGEHFAKPTYTTALGVTSFDRSCGIRAPTRRDGETSSETPCADAQS